MAQLTKDYDNLVGDVLVSAGMIAYSGPFTPDFRQKLVKGWQEKLVELGIPHSDGCDVRLTLADPVQVWNSNPRAYCTRAAAVSFACPDSTRAQCYTFVDARHAERNLLSAHKAWRSKLSRQLFVEPLNAI